MKKLLPLLIFALLLLYGNSSRLYAQCYGTVNFDNAVNANGTSSFDITTSYCNELIMISYDGWTGPGNGPVTVDGNPATHINTAFVYYYAVAETYAYIAPAAGTHTIVCTERPYVRPYYLNSAAAFYVTGSGLPISIGSITNAQGTVSCVGGGSVSANIATTIPGSMIYDNFDCNNGQTGPFTDSWTGATWLNQLHEGNGIDQSEAYTTAASPGTYSVTANCSASPFPCGGLALLIAAIPPPLCGGGGGLTASATQSNPTCGVCNGSITISVNGGSPPFTYSWTPNVSSDSTASGLCSGTYSISVNDANCHDTTIVIVLPPNSLNLVDTLQVNESCNGNCNGSAQINVNGGHSPYTYSWAPTGGNASSANNLCAGIYTVTVQDNNGCSNTIHVNITQPTALTASTGVTNVLCNGGTGSATSSVSGGVAPYTYSWTPGGLTTANVTGISAGSYTVNVTDNHGCLISAIANITQPAPLAVTISGPSIVCTGSNGTLTANVTGGTSPYTSYAWAPVGGNGSTVTIAPNANTTYTVTVTDANGCTASGQITVDIGPSMTVSISGAHSICNGLSTTLCAAINGGTGGNTYSWQPMGDITPCITVSPNTNTTYTLTVVDNCGTTATAVTTLRVNPLPATAFTANFSNGCTPLCIQFYNTTTLAQGTSAVYAWTFGDGDSMATQNPIHCYENSGTFSVGLTVTSDSGCSSTLSKSNMITAFQKPIAGFTSSPASPTILNPLVQFTDKSYDQYGLIYWQWNFGETGDTASTLENPTHVFRDTGTYCVSMIEMDQHGCMDTTTNCIVINPDFKLYIPSAFSPNGDRKNPIFKPEGQYIKSFEMYIFDRWGMQIFHSNSINQGWDGSVDGGNVAQEDTYEYKIIVTDTQKKQHTFVGNVTLIK